MDWVRYFALSDDLRPIHLDQQSGEWLSTPLNTHQFCGDGDCVIGDYHGQDVCLLNVSVHKARRSLARLTWLWVIEENKKMAEGSERKNPCAAARK